MMRYFAIAVAVLAGFLFSSNANGMFVPKEFSEMLAEATMIVKVKAIGVETEKHGDFPDHFQKLEVEKVLSGQCDQKIIYADLLGRLGGPRYKVGEECYLFLEHDEGHPGKYQDVDYGYGKIEIKDGKVVPWQEKLSDDNRLKNLTPEGFEDLINSLRAPTLTIKPKKESFSYDEPIEFSVAIKNERPDSMKLSSGWKTSFGEQCELKLWDAQGFSCSERIFEGRKSKSKDDSPMEKESFPKRLDAGSTFTTSARFFLHQDDFQQSPEMARLAVFRYSGYPAIQARCAIHITCPDAWAENLIKPCKAFAVSLEARRYVQPLPGIPLRLMFMRPAYPEVKKESHGESLDFNMPDEVKKAIASCLRVEHDGKVLAGAPPESEPIMKWSAARSPWPSKQGIEFNIADYWPIDAPGVYRVRFVLPDKDGDALSNVVQFTVPEKNAP